MACGGPPDDAPADTGEGGAAGAPSDDPADGGAPVEEPRADCSRDADCDDGLACNGLEVCSKGACEEGTPPECTHGTECVEHGSETGACEFVDAGPWVVFTGDQETPATFEPYAIREKLIGIEAPIKLDVPRDPDESLSNVWPRQWSFDGQYVTVETTSSLDFGATSLHVVPLGAGLPGVPIEIVTGAEWFSADWSPASQSLLVGSDQGLDIVWMQGTEAVRHPCLAGGFSGSWRWSPRGDSFAVMYASSDGSEDLSVDLIELDEKGAVRASTTIMKGGQELDNLFWSPDGSKLAIHVSPGGYDDDSLHIVSVDDPTTTTKITPTRASDLRSISSVAWSPNGRFFAYVEDSHSIYSIFLYDTERPELGAVEVESDLEYAGLRTWYPDSSSVIFSIRRIAENDRWILIDSVEMVQVQDANEGLSQVVWLDPEHVICRTFQEDEQALVVADVFPQFFASNPRAIDTLSSAENSLLVSSIVRSEGVPMGVLYRKEGTLLFGDIRNRPFRPSAAIANDVHGLASTDSAAFFTLPDEEGYYDLYRVDLSGRSPGELQPVNETGAVYSFAVQPQPQP